MSVLNSSIMQPSYNILGNFYKDSAQKVKDQNNILDKEIQRHQGSTSANFRKSDYENKETQTIMNIYSYMLWFYYLFAIIFCIYIIVVTPYSVVIKGGIVVLFGVLPFLLYYTEVIIYNIVMWIYSLATSKVYSNVYMNNY